MNRLTKIFLRNPGQWQFWVILALFVKGLIFLLQIAQAQNGGLAGFLGSFGGDTKTYIDPIDNLLRSGSYEPDQRMPGYGIIYFFLRLGLTKVIALNVLLFLQYIAASLSVYLLALSARKIFQSTAIFYTVFYLFLISTYSNLEDATLLTESLTNSFLIFAVYFLLNWRETYRTIYLIIAGILTTEVIFLRPIFLPLLLLFALFILLTARKSGKRYFLKYALVFLVPFILIDGAWIVRNFAVNKRFIPLMATLYGENEDGVKPKVEWAAIDFLKCWGGNYVWWDPRSEMRYFNIRETPANSHGKLMQDKFKPIPSDIYTSVFNADSLAALRDVIATIDFDSSLANCRDCAYVVAKFKKYGLSIKKEKPFLYYIIAPARMFSNFFVHSGTYNLFSKPANELNKLEFLTKIAYSLFYVFSLILGFTGLVLLIPRSLLFGPESLVTGIVAYTTVIHPLILRLCEARYFMPAWPFLLVLVAYTLIWVRNKFVKS